MEGNESIGEPHRRTENRRIEYMRKGKAKESIESKSALYLIKTRMSSCCSRITCFPDKYARNDSRKGRIHSQDSHRQNRFFNSIRSSGTFICFFNLTAPPASISEIVKAESNTEKNKLQFLMLACPFLLTEDFLSQMSEEGNYPI